MSEHLESKIAESSPAPGMLRSLIRWFLAMGILARLALVASTVGVVGGAVYRIESTIHTAAGPEPAVGLYWQTNTDPTIAPGVVAPLWQLLWRTDAPSIYFKSGAAATAWTKVGDPAGGGGGVSGTGTPPDLSVWTAANAIGNFAGSSPAACAAGSALTRVTSAATGALTFTCTPITPGGSISGTVPDIAIFTGAGASVGNYAGSSPSACAAGNALSRVTVDATGALAFTCSPFAPASAVSGTLNQVAKFTSASTVGNGWATDDGTTWGVVNIFTITEGTGAYTFGAAGVGVTPQSAEIRGGVAASATVPTLIPNQSSTTSGVGADAAGDVSIIAGGVENLRCTGAVRPLVSMVGVSATGWLLPTTSASSTAPTFVPNRADATTGIGAQAAGNVSIVIGGVEGVQVNSAGLAEQIAGKIIAGGNVNAGAIINSAASATVPTFVPNRAALSTGIGADTSGDVSLIAGGVEQIRLLSGTGTIVQFGPGVSTATLSSYGGGRASVGYDGSTAVFNGGAGHGVLIAGNGVTSSPQFAIANNGTTPSVGIGGAISSTTTLAGAMIIATANHLLTNGTALTGSNLSACGTSPSINAKSTDVAGQLTEGTTATGCTITFANTYTVAPFCVCNASTAIAVGCTATATALTIVNASASGDVINYHCLGANGGT